MTECNEAFIDGEFHDAVEHAEAHSEDQLHEDFASPHSSPRQSASSLDGMSTCRTYGTSEPDVAESVTVTDEADALTTLDAPSDTEGNSEQQGCEEVGTVNYEEMLRLAEDHKLAGNTHFKAGRHEEALAEYAAALRSAPPDANERAVYFANSGACHMARCQYEACVRSCSDAIAIDSTYVKAINRRMLAFEALDKLDSALEDAKQIAAIDPGNAAVQQRIRTWEPIVRERQEKMKEEVVGKLKDLGNNILGRFGMSLDNFNMVQDPNTGGYSINFKQ